MARRSSAATLERINSSSTAYSNSKWGGAANEPAYAKAVKACSDLPIASTFYSFQHYTGLSDFFNEAAPTRSLSVVSKESVACEKTGSEAFVHFHTYTSEGLVHKKCVKGWGDLQDHLYKPQVTNVSGTLVFLSGYQPPDWLIAVGERYKIDHEFWRRHLDFDRGTGRYEVYTDSSLPSNNIHMLQLCATTLGEKSETRSRGKTNHALLSDLRVNANVSMRKYSDRLSKRKIAMRHGDSVVRNFTLHDLDHFSIEQNISIWVGNEANGAWITVVWLDFGRNLSHTGDAPWQSESKSKTAPVHCKPTIQHRPGIVLDRRRSNFGNAHKSPMKVDDESAIAQTACLLRMECGNLIDKNVACRDVYYALSDIFRFVASSEAQFLEMTQVLLTKEIDPAALSKSSAHKPAIMWNLQYNRLALMSHIQRIKGVVEFMESQPDLGWPEAKDDTQRKVAENMAKLMLKDYRHLLRRAESLSEEYQSGMTMLMNAATVDESQRAISQAEGVAKLTTLAFFFIPISFTTSIFGMNFTEISDGNHLSIWVWAVTAIASLIFSFLCLKWFSWKSGGQDLSPRIAAWTRKSSKDSKLLEEV